LLVHVNNHSAECTKCGERQPLPEPQQTDEVEIPAS
jgi:hypothetical protein